jgi:uncharacterized RDD family membrane protein YckC
MSFWCNKKSRGNHQLPIGSLFLCVLIASMKINNQRYIKREEVLLEGELRLAPLYLRVLAFFIDLVLIIILYILIIQIMDLLGYSVIKLNIKGFMDMEIETENMSEWASYVVKFILIIWPTIYFTLSVFFFSGRTFGKWICRLLIKSLYHNYVGFWHCVERSLGYVASTLEFGLGFIQAAWNHNRMALHDKIAETIVVVVPKKNNKKSPND